MLPDTASSGGDIKLHTYHHGNSSGAIVASFPGLPRFFCSSVSVDNNTRMRRKKFAALPHPCIIVNETEEQKKRGRPENEARHDLLNQVKICLVQRPMKPSGRGPGKEISLMRPCVYTPLVMGACKYVYCVQ